VTKYVVHLEVVCVCVWLAFSTASGVLCLDGKQAKRELEAASQTKAGRDCTVASLAFVSMSFCSSGLLFVVVVAAAPLADCLANCC